MGFIGIQSPTACWTSSTRIKQIADYMLLVRFEEIYCYIHTRCQLEEETSERVVEEDDAEVDLDEDRRVDAVWYGKLELLAQPIREKFKRYIKLQTEVSIDEMMVRCTRRTQHTTKV